VSAARVIGAGATFAFTTVLGMLVGIWLAGRTGQSLWVLGGLFGGLVVGAAGAWRLVAGAL
jgi:hypothetical protein